ncbi:Flagellar basal body-associated protein FliL [uncultured Desulfatiglans sp.]|uniref:Flagellar protein FliL n=1 Tax=Uncultured Desulfatiglans sp. TaxID=1748965 RepID=A0A653A495_UNCDX|nr:Flagellar basal body-associated protein FliL [uncultured Desulfatiglans sp.]
MSRKTLFMILGGMVLFVVLIAAGFFVMWQRMTALQLQPETSAPAAAPTETEIDDPARMLGPTFALDTFIVNLSDDHLNRYLRVTMELELGNPTLADELKKRLPQVRDCMLKILPVKHSVEIQGVAGKEALRMEIMSTLNSFLKTGEVVNIYFTEFVIQ